jgi:hypothetical protein
MAIVVSCMGESDSGKWMVMVRYGIVADAGAKLRVVNTEVSTLNPIP